MALLNRFSLIIVSLFVFNACATVNPTQSHYAMSSWVDLYYVDVIYQLGYPEFVFEDQVNGRVLVYNNIENEVNTSQLNNYDSEFEDQTRYIVWENQIERAVPTRIERETDLLFVNQDGIIYSYQSNKNDKIVREEYESEVVIVGVVSTIALIGLLLLGS